MASRLSKAYWSAFTLWHARKEDKIPYLPIEVIVGIQDRRVRAAVKHAYETVPYYRDVMDEAGLLPRDFRTADDLVQLPIVSGEEVAAAPERFLSSRCRGRRAIRLHSSGTSGLSKHIYYDSTALFLSLAHGHRQRVVLAQFVDRMFGYREMTVVRRDTVNVLLRAFYESHCWIPRKVDYQRDILPSTDTYEENIRQINIFQPDVIRGYGSYIGALFRRAREQSLPVFRPKVVLYGVDHMADVDRLLIEREFGVPVLSGYEATEALRIAFQCEKRDVFHINLDHVAVGAVDRNGATVGPGETGEIVISNLVNRATVLLNYKLGDLVALGESPCPCGRTLPTIERLAGRADGLIALPGGQKVHSLTVLSGLQAVPGVVQVQLTQEQLRRFLVLAVCTGETDWDQTRRDLDAAMRSTLGDDIALEARRVEAIPPGRSGKVRAVISRCAG